MIAGLGNPGRRYRDTRHNLGFRVIEELARRRGVVLAIEQCNARVGEREGVLLAAPQTYMNRSGHAVRCLVELRALRLEDVLIVYDDIHLPLGRLRLRPEGGPGGHRGMESAIENLRSVKVPRLRLGVGPRTPAAELPADLADLVLSPFAADEVGEVPALITTAADAAEHWLREGIGPAMNRYNR
jgi:PTH1 family peptidyl-tRNA hydrolase